MKRGFALLLSLLLLSSVVSAASLFEGSAWDEWLTGNQVLRLFKFRQATAPAAQVQVQTTTSQSYYIPNLYFEAAQGPVNAEQYNRLLNHYEDVIKDLQKQKRLDFITKVGLIDFAPEDYIHFGISQSTLYSYLVVQFSTRDYGVFVVTQEGNNPLDGVAALLTPNFKVKAIGKKVDPSFVTGSLRSLQAKNSGHTITEDCGVYQEGVLGLNKDAIINPLRNDERQVNRAQAAPTAQDIRNQQRFGPGGSRVNPGPGTGFVTQSRDQTGGAERSKPACNRARTQARTEELKRKQEQREQANKEREQVSGEGSSDAEEFVEEAEAGLTQQQIDEEAQEALDEIELKEMQAQHEEAFTQAVRSARLNEGFKSAMNKIQARSK